MWRACELVQLAEMPRTEQPGVGVLIGPAVVLTERLGRGREFAPASELACHQVIGPHLECVLRHCLTGQTARGCVSAQWARGVAAGPIRRAWGKGLPGGCHRVCHCRPKLVVARFRLRGKGQTKPKSKRDR